MAPAPAAAPAMRLAWLLAAAACAVIAQCEAAAAASDISLSISQDTLNSASRVYTAGGALAFAGQLRDLRGQVVNTTVFKLLVPAAYAACPGCPIDFQLSADRLFAPDVTISAATGAMLAARFANMNLTTRPNASAKPTFMFALQVNATAGLTFSHVPVASGDFLKANATVVASHFSVTKSAFGPASAGLLDLVAPLLNRFIDTVVVTEFNAMFPGIPIPGISGVNLTNVAITTEAGRLALSLDISIAPDQANARSRLAAALAPPAAAHALPPGFSAPGFEGSIAATGLNKVLSEFVPEIVKEVNSLQIPGMSGKASGIDYSIDTIKLGGFAIGKAAVAFEAGKGLMLSLSDITLKVPSTHFEVKKKVVIVHVSCGGHFDGSLGGSNSVCMHLNVTATADGQPHITPTSAWSWGKLSVSEHMDHTACKIVQDIAKVFVGSINGKIEDAIKKAVPTAVDSLISGKGNKMLSQLVLSKKIDKWATVNFYMTQNPLSTAAAMEVDLSGEFVPSAP